MTQVDHRPGYEQGLREKAHPLGDREMCDRSAAAAAAAAEATAISRAAAAVATALVILAGLAAAFGMLQLSGLALFGALATSIASVAGRPSRGYRWVGPLTVGGAMLTVIVAGFTPAP